MGRCYRHAAPKLLKYIQDGPGQRMRHRLKRGADIERAREFTWRGVLVALSNPKTIAFFTAFLPQFIDPNLPPERQLAVMCIAAVALAAVTDSTWAVAAGLGRAGSSSPRAPSCWGGSPAPR